MGRSNGDDHSGVTAGDVEVYGALLEGLPAEESSRIRDLMREHRHEELTHDADGTKMSKPVF